MHNKKIKNTGLKIIFALSTLLLLLFACKVEDAGATDSTDGGTDTKKQWTLTIDPQNGSGVTTQNVTDGQTATVTSPLKTGFNFGGWSYSATGTTVNFTSGQTIVTEDHKLFAIWLPPYVKSITKSIAGMREFAANIEAQNVPDTGVTLELIVSDSSTAPLYESEVKSNVAKYTRKFTSTNLTRQVYFSATKDIKTDNNHDPILNPDTAGNVNTTNNLIDISTVSGDPAKNAIIKAANPGLILPATDYYVHVYKDGVWQFVSSAIHTQQSPTSYLAPFTRQTTSEYQDSLNGNAYTPALHSFGMSEWRLAGSYKSIEVKSGEINLIPIRLSRPAVSPVCINSSSTSFKIYPFNINYDSQNNITSITDFANNASLYGTNNYIISTIITDSTYNANSITTSNQNIKNVGFKIGSDNSNVDILFNLRYMFTEPLLQGLNNFGFSEKNNCITPSPDFNFITTVLPTKIITE